MDNAYVHGLRQYDSRPRSPVIIPLNLSELRKRILRENTLLEERTLHEFSAGKGDGAGVDTGSAAAPSGIPVTGASQPLFINFGSGDERNGTYLGSSTEWVNHGYSNNYKLVAPGARNNATWTFFDDDNYVEVSPSNPSTNPNFIPTSGWIDPSITITAAPTPSQTPTPTITPTVTPTTTQFPGISTSNDYIAVNYGNQNIFLFGSHTVVQRNYGYDPDVVWDNTMVNGSIYKIALLDFNFHSPGSWSFVLDNQSFGVAGYAWKNNSTNSSIIPTGGWFGFVPFNSNYQAGSATLILSATSQPVTPTPTPTPTITPTPSNTPGLYDIASKASIQDTYNLLKDISNPVKNYTNFSLLCTLGFNNFCNDWSGVTREWNPNFWGYAHRNILNFSGVSHNTELNATLITPQHFIGNTHFAPSLSCCFYDHNTGQAVHIKIQDYRTFGEDSYVGKLASPVPAVSAIKIYKIAAATSNIPIRGNQFPLFYIGGKAFTTNDNCFHGGCVGSTKNNPLGANFPFPRSYIDTYSTSLSTVSAAFAGKDFASNGIEGGESSNPMFILLDNDLLLYGTFYFTDNGPWWGSQSILANVTAAIIEMGSEGYSVSAVYLDQYVPPTATPTPTPTNTIALSPTPTITPTPTRTPAPAGIPVASTNSIAIAGYGTFVKKIGSETITSDGLTLYDGVAYARTPLSTSPNAIVLFGPPPTYTGDMSPVEFSEWTLYSVGPYEGGDVNAWLNGALIASSTSNDIASIPTGGWTPIITITVPTFPDVATTSTVNALINTSDATTTSYLQSVGFTAVGGVFSVPLTKQVPPSENYYSVEYKTTFSDGATCYLVHSTAANNRWFFFMEKFSYYDEEFGNQFDTLISISTTTGQSNATIPAARSAYSGTNINSMVSPDCFS